MGVMGIKHWLGRLDERLDRFAPCKRTHLPNLCKIAFFVEGFVVAVLRGTALHGSLSYIQLPASNRYRNSSGASSWSNAAQSSLKLCSDGRRDENRERREMLDEDPTTIFFDVP